MPTRTVTPLGALGRGLLAGAAGTAAMTAAQTALYRAQGSEPSTTPAEVARRVIEGVFRKPVSDERIGLLNTAMHWLYGTSWGAAYGVVAESAWPNPLLGGLLFGGVVWGASLVQLPALGLAPPVWEYPPSSLAQDIGFHAVYGLGAGLTHAALARAAR
jgi:hypothetical protein